MIFRFSTFLLSFGLFSFTMSAQSLSQRLSDTYDTFREPALTERRFRHKDLVPLMQQLPASFEVTEVGKSTQNRSISQVRLGNGPVKVLLWSQMHGDEATATMAIFDLFRFFAASGDGFDDLRTEILSRTTLYFVPMLNPDGAEAWTRRTALGIDMNRDALRLQTPEGRLLKQLQQTLQPTFAFNLHDQSPRYSAGPTGKLATVSFLATAYNEAREINDVRKRSMQLIVGLNRMLQTYIPGQVARYSDEFEPRAFGDNIQKWGSSLILIESGGYAGDPEKLYIRKLNYLALLTGLQAIASGSYRKEDIKAYETIPENGRAVYDLLVRNVHVVRNGQAILTDIAVNRQELAVFNRPEKWYIRGTVEEFGDLSVFFGTQELDATGLTIEGDVRMGVKADFELKSADGQVKYRIENGTLLPVH
ncbi:M14 family zinc carboxypeptidase [Siphonobacter aquaeclarae]|uniref:Zinc carboxypeptidase n=1 Tax=Siphonobacter aquaeclarae TaxID=563176 RepID=A0A1G9NBY0_9BACT|nr:M14 family zinc carboxypeptidase [Siphonobacter aquaeclarae]SDL83883.1 Zinc carboxypeptidase [Siphonobacter aquaeclarae]